MMFKNTSMSPCPIVHYDNVQKHINVSVSYSADNVQNTSMSPCPIVHYDNVQKHINVSVSYSAL